MSHETCKEQGICTCETRMTLSDYLIAVAEYHYKYKGSVRIGQAYFNCLPESIAKEIVGNYGYLDPCNNDDALPQLLAYLSVRMG